MLPKSSLLQKGQILEQSATQKNIYICHKINAALEFSLQLLVCLFLHLTSSSPFLIRSSSAKKFFPSLLEALQIALKAF